MIQKLELRIPPVVQVAIFALAMWLLDRWFPAAALELPANLWMAILLAVAGAAIALSGVWEFRRAKTTVDPRVPDQASSLVTGGIYRYSRNPMYVGFLLALLGWAIYLANPFSLLMLPLFVVVMNRLQIIPEERFMLEKFGAEFTNYKASVRRWI
ncbi:methyltransferase family protein [Lacimicrobium alkaliphilum]|uniref:Protein-S-isoprenylcysteine methyltransferase n=1 Tax=Lacimicrobium alkaliphilum TaxID=1526571 RepID=A0A0U3AVR2_9ALTE|nr:isoprenylcysteine carboxylmethyltransferase family protein [Lacimicrobium alkaliphilum]ALS97032.1 protein-S-isoprenylcysteine methyltransferase [Lacimicrobium alkaliphilum]